VTRKALLDGPRAAVLTALGINLGVLFWVTAAALGLARRGRGVRAGVCGHPS
jgi:threonine/homoserine/homoserine lactone efflux protein